MVSEAQKEANRKYRKKVKRLTLDFSPAESELLEHIESHSRKQTYIKNLIREDMKKGRT